jgi:hypothetical protein
MSPITSSVILEEPAPTARRSTAPTISTRNDLEAQKDEKPRRPTGVRRTTSSSFGSFRLELKTNSKRRDTSFSNDSTLTSPVLERQATQTTWRVEDEALHGYPKLAKFMGGTGGYAIYKRFAALNARNLLYHQARLTRLEHELNDLEQAFAQEEDLRYKVDHIFQDEHGPGTAGYKLRMKYKEISHALEKYNRLLREQDALHKLPSPDPSFVDSIWRIITSEKAPKQDWLQHPESTIYAVWDDDRKPIQTDLVTLNPEFKEQDLFTKFFISNLVLWFHNVYSRFKVSIIHQKPHLTHNTDIHLQKPASDSDFDEISYSEKTINRTMTAIVMIVASALPTSSIVALYFIQSSIWRLIFIVLFSGVFASALALFTECRRVEIFAATVALASVQVVFVGTAFGNGNGNGNGNNG